MSTIVTRAGKGSPLTHNEVDSNFTNLNNDKYQSGSALGTPASGTLTNCTGYTYSNLSGTVPTWNQNTTGNAATVTNGVYTVGNQTIDGTKTFSSTIVGSINGNAATVTNGVYTTNIGSTVMAFDSNLQSFVNTFTLPTTDSTNGYVLATNGSGTLSFVAQSGGGSGTVTSVAMTVPTGLSVSGSPITSSGTLAVSYASGYAIPTTAKQTEWDSAYTQRLQWDGGATNLVAATGRSSLLPSYTSNAGKVLAVNTGATDVEWIAVGGSGTVTSVSGTGTVNGITLTGTVTTSGSLTLGGTLSGIGNAQLTNSSITVNGTAISLGASGTITANTTNALTIGTGLSGTSFNGSSAVTIANTGVLSNVAGTGISVSGATGNVTITNSAPMTYPGAGIPNSTGSAWGTSYTTSGSGTVVALATGATLTNPLITGTITEDVFTITDGAGFAIDPTNGSIQTITLGASRTPTVANFEAGEAITLMINDGTAYTITWTTIGVVWVGGTAPTLATTGFTVIELWRVGSTYYGALVGNVA